MDKTDTPMDADQLKEMILAERKNGNVVFWALPGQLAIAGLDALVEQPAEGLLYDLNRLEEISLTFMKTDPKWVNDFAVALVIRKLMQQRNDARTNDARTIERDLAAATKRVEVLEGALRDAGIAAYCQAKEYTRDDVQQMISRVGARGWDEARKIASANARAALSPKTEGK